MATVKRTSGWGDNEITEDYEIPDAIIWQASGAAEAENRMMVIGKHPYFGWVYRDAEDTAAIAEIGTVWEVSAFGLEGECG